MQDISAGHSATAMLPLEAMEYVASVPSATGILLISKYAPSSKDALGFGWCKLCGKTYSSLLIAYGMTADWSKIAVIDSENCSADLYAHLGASVCTAYWQDAIVSVPATEGAQDTTRDGVYR